MDDNRAQYEWKMRPEVKLLLMYLGIWVCVILTYYVIAAFAAPDFGTFYGLVIHFVVFGIATFVVAFIIGRKDYFGNWKWLVCLAFACMNMLIPIFTYKLHACIDRHRQFSLLASVKEQFTGDWVGLLLWAITPGLVGMIIGQLIALGKKAAGKTDGQENR